MSKRLLMTLFIIFTVVLIRGGVVLSNSPMVSPVLDFGKTSPVATPTVLRTHKTETRASQQIAAQPIPTATAIVEPLLPETGKDLEDK